MPETRLYRYLATDEVELETTDPVVIRRAMLAQASRAIEKFIYLDGAGEVEIAGVVTATQIGDPELRFAVLTKET